MSSCVNVGCCVALDPSQRDLGYGGQGQAEAVLKNFTNPICEGDVEIDSVGSGGDTVAGRQYFGELGEGNKLFVGKEMGERA
jgi:hypothetical protein